MTSRSRFLFFGMMVLGVVVGVFISSGLQRALSPSPSPAAPVPVPPLRRPSAMPSIAATSTAEERHTIALFKDVSRSVAFITTQVEQVDFWTRSVTEIPAGTGSGFVWDEQGHVVTNFHVVQGGETAKVTVGVDEYPAKLVGYRASRISRCCGSTPPRAKLVPIRVGTSAELQVGQKVLRDRQPVRPRLHADDGDRERARPRRSRASATPRSST